MKLTAYHYSLVITLLYLPFCLYARSLYRIDKTPIPSISIYNKEKKLCSTISDSHLELYPQFAFTIDALKKYEMPTAIPYLNNRSRLLTKKRIDRMIEQFILELHQGKREDFTHFTVLKSKNFNFHHHCGLLILKCNYHPFIIKLFIEQPETYFKHHYKGVESIAFFFMGAGANRHISGMSRLLNLDFIKKKLHSLSQWKHYVKFPRKWFWLPKNNRCMYLVGKNMGNKKIIFNKIPEVFAIIADEIECNETLDITSQEKEKIIIKLCNDFDSFLDAHYDNFIFKKDHKKGFTVTIIDTEHFPTMVGFKRKRLFKNYWQWYGHLCIHYLKKTLFRTKKDRILAQRACNELALL